MKRRVVIDANILIRAVFGIRVRNMMEKCCVDTACYAAEANVEEALRYVPKLAKKRGVNESVWREALETLMTMIQLVPQDELAAVKSDALARNRKVAVKIVDDRGIESLRIVALD